VAMTRNTGSPPGQGTLLYTLQKMIHKITLPYIL